MTSQASKPIILVVDNSRAVTGAINAMRHATTPLRNEFEFLYVLPVGSTARRALEADGYQVYELPFVEISRRKLDLLRYLPMLLLNGWRLHKLARQQKAVLIHLNDFYNLTGYIAKLLSFGALRVVVHVRFLPQALPKPLARMWSWLARVGAERVVCVSEAVGRYFRSGPQIQVVYDPLPGSERYPVPTHPTRSDGTLHLLYLSNYIQGKGQDLALMAFRDAYAQNPHLRLHFAGGDMGMTKNQEFRQKLEDDVVRYGLQSVVLFSGFVADVEVAMKEADIVLNFSEAESFSLTCLDALYFGTPLIASDCGGPAELFEHGDSGFLVPNRDLTAMTAAITALAADTAARIRFAAASRYFVRQKFAPAHTYRALAALYQQVIGGVVS